MAQGFPPGAPAPSACVFVRKRALREAVRAACHARGHGGDESQSITFKEEKKDTTRTLPVESMAAQFIAELEPGDKVILTCRGDDEGKLLAVTGIKKG